MAPKYIPILLILPIIILLTLSTNSNKTKQDLCLSWPQKETSINTTKSCPDFSNGLFLSRLYPAKAILIGHSKRDEHNTFLEEYINQLPMQLKKVIFTSHNNFSKINEIFNKTNKRSDIKILAYSGDDFLWVQDYFKIYMNQEKDMSLFEVPYPDKTVSKMIQKFSNQCSIKNTRKTNKGNIIKYNTSGDFAGNIYPLTDKIILIGNNMSLQVEQQLAKVTSQEIIRINTSWLETGHVDEVISQIPTRKRTTDGNLCPFNIAFPSPSLAMKLINLDSTERIELTNLLPAFIESNEEYANCILSLAKDTKKTFESVECMQLKLFNREIVKSMNRTINKIKDSVYKIEKCNIDKFIPFPVLFTPIDKTDFSSSKGLVRPVNSNPINNVLIKGTIFLPFQKYGPFKQYLNLILQEMDLNTKYLIENHLQEMGGGIHCMSQVVRDCI